jgi:YHS domain-containing protein
MMRFIIFIILSYLLYRVLKNLLLTSSTHTQPSSHPPDIITDEMVMDPHCHLYIPKRDALTAQIAGETLYFCSRECKKAYLNKERFQQRLP